MASKDLLLPSRPPAFNPSPRQLWNHAARITGEVQRFLENAFTGGETPTYDNVIALLVQATNRLAHVKEYLEAIKKLNPYSEAGNAVHDILDWIGEREKVWEDVYGRGLYEKIRSARQRHASQADFDQGIMAALEQMYYRYMQQSSQLAARQEEKQLTASFLQNCREDSVKVWVPRRSFTQADIATFRRQQHWQPRGDGLYREFPTRGSAEYAAAEFESSDVRRGIYIAAYTAWQKNNSVVEKSLRIRQRIADEEGFSSYARYRLSRFMVSDPEIVTDTLLDLWDKLAPSYDDWLLEMKVWKRRYHPSTTSDSAVSSLQLWDINFLSRKLDVEREGQVNFSEYFPLDLVVNSMLEIFAELFGLRFRQLTSNDFDRIVGPGTGQNHFWEPEVRLFAVVNNRDDETRATPEDQTKEDEFLGYLYLDLYYREEKEGQAENCWTFGSGYHDEGARQYQCSVINFQFPKPDSARPILLNHHYITVLVHELGHGIHDFVCVPHLSTFASRNVEQDFQEIPSLLLEKWMALPNVLQRLSHHYSYISSACFADWSQRNATSRQPPESLDVEDCQKMIDQSHGVNLAKRRLYEMRQVFSSLLDLALNGDEMKTSHGVSSKSIWDFYNSLQKEVLKLDGMEMLGTDGKIAYWGPLKALANDEYFMYTQKSCLYSYQLGRIIAADIWHTKFKGDPMSETTMREWRDEVLRHGSSKPMKDALLSFLGRPWSTTPFYRELGLLEDADPIGLSQSRQRLRPV